MKLKDLLVYENYKQYEKDLPSVELLSLERDIYSLESKIDQTLDKMEYNLESVNMLNRQLELISTEDINEDILTLLSISLESIAIHNNLEVISLEGETTDKIKQFIQNILKSFSLLYEKIMKYLTKWIQKVRTFIFANKKIDGLDKLITAIKDKKDITLYKEKDYDLLILLGKELSPDGLDNTGKNKILKDLNLSSIDMTKLSINMSTTDFNNTIKLEDYKLVFAGNQTFLVKNKNGDFLTKVKVSLDEVKRVFDLKDNKLNLGDIDKSLLDIDKKAIMRKIDESFNKIKETEKELKSKLDNLSDRDKILKTKNAYLNLIKILRNNMILNTGYYIAVNRALKLAVSKLSDTPSNRDKMVLHSNLFGITITV